MLNKSTKIKLKSNTGKIKTRYQMAEEFGWGSPKTFKSKLEQHGITLPGGSITPAWQKVIYEKLGYPEGVNKDDLE